MHPADAADARHPRARTTRPVAAAPGRRRDPAAAAGGGPAPLRHPGLRGDDGPRDRRRRRGQRRADQPLLRLQGGPVRAVPHRRLDRARHDGTREDARRGRGIHGRAARRPVLGRAPQPAACCCCAPRATSGPSGSGSRRCARTRWAWWPWPGGSPDGPGAEQRLLRAQLALSVALGVALMRSATALEPLASADRADLVGPLGSVLHALLAPEQP